MRHEIYYLERPKANTDYDDVNVHCTIQISAFILFIVFPHSSFI